MIRIFKLVLLLVVSQVAFGQAPSNYTNINGRYRWIAGMFDSTFHIPKGTSPSLRTGGSTNAGGLFYNTSDSSVYTYTGTQWIKARGSINPSDTTNKYVTQVYKKNGSDSVFYVKGGNHLFAFVDSVGSPGGGGGGKIYYFNGGVSMGTIGGLQMYELGDTANTGAAANFTRATTGNIANFITDPGKPGLVQIPAGVWSVDAWLSETGGGANHAEIWIEVEKWDGSTITTIATSPIEQITEGSTPNLYSWSVSIPTTSLTVTDRIIIQFYISNTNGKTVTLYTQNGYVGEVHTTFTTGIGAINGLTAPAQYLVTGTSGTDFNINSVTATHTFNLPTASATNRGALSSTDWTTFNSKIGGSGTTNYVSKFTGSGTIGNSQIFDNATSVGIGTAFPSASYKLDVNGNINVSNAVNYSQGGTKYGWTYATSGAMAMEGLQGADISLGTGSGAVATERMVIKNSGIVGIGITPDSMFTVAQGTHLQRGVRMSGLPSAVGTKSLRIDASGTVSVADTGSFVPTSRTLTINGTTHDLSADRTWNVGTVTTAAATGGGQVAFFNGSTVLTSISTLYFDGVNKLAIGSSSPDSMLSVTQGAHIQRGVRLSGLPTAPGTRALRVDANGTLSVSDTLTNGISGSGTTNYIPKFTSSSAIGNSLLREGTNSIGLGYTPSTWSYTGFQINGAALHGSPTETDAGLSANAYYNSGWKYYANNYASQYRQVNGEHEFNIAGIGTAGNSVSFSTAIKILTSGNVGIGTTNPQRALHVKSGAGTAQIESTATTSMLYFADANSTGIDNRGIGSAGNDLWFMAGATEKMRLDASGNLGLGVSPSAWETSTAFQLGNQYAFTKYGITRNAVYNAGYKYIANGFANSFEMNGGAYEWYTAPSGTATNNITFTKTMTLDASGNLGLGVTPSAWTGTGVKAFQFQNGFLAASSSFGTWLSWNAYYDGGDKYVSSSTAGRYLIEGNVHRWDIAPSGTAGNAISFTQAMTLDASGRLGIGATIPTSLLHVNSGTTATQTVANFAAANYGSSSSRTYIQIGTQFGDGSSRIGSINTTGNQSALVFQTQSATSGVWNDAMYINGSGNVGIGTTSPIGKLDVSLLDTRRFIVTYDDATITIKGASNTGAGENLRIIGDKLIFNTGSVGSGTERMRITAEGEVYIGNNPADQGAYNLQVNGTGVWGAGAYVDGSDSAVKKNIQPLGSSLDLIKQMNPVTFEYQPFYSKDTTTQTGFIAQELQQVLSDKVYKNGIVKEGGQYLGVAYQHLIPLLVKSIQELEAQVQALKSQLNNR